MRKFKRMIRQIISITLKELKVLWFDREALALLFAMPMFFILVMSFALEGVFQTGSKSHPIEILVVHKKGGPLADQAIADLKRMEGFILIETHEGIPLTSDKAEQLIGRGVYPLALLFPEGYTERVLEISNDPQKGKATVSLISDPAINLQLLTTIKGAIQGAIERPVLLAGIPQRLKEMFGTLAGMEGQLDTMLGNKNIRGREGSGVDLIQTFPKGLNAGRHPTATEQNVPAYTIFGVFFIVLTLASSFLQEKKDGTFQRILAAPLSKTALLIGKLLPYYLVNLIQIGLMFCIGFVVFGIRLGHLPALVIVSLALAAAANGLGLLVAALGKTEPTVGSSGDHPFCLRGNDGTRFYHARSDEDPFSFYAPCLGPGRIS
jgi:ABC-2 type transport system permease protein